MKTGELKCKYLYLTTCWKYTNKRIVYKSFTNSHGQTRNRAGRGTGLVDDSFETIQKIDYREFTVLLLEQDVNHPLSLSDRG